MLQIRLQNRQRILEFLELHDIQRVPRKPVIDPVNLGFERRQFRLQPVKLRESVRGAFQFPCFQFRQKFFSPFVRNGNGIHVAFHFLRKFFLAHETALHARLRFALVRATIVMKSPPALLDVPLGGDRKTAGGTRRELPKHKLIHLFSSKTWSSRGCRAKNLNTDNYSFLNRCENCKTVPKSYRCHHLDCGKIILLGRDPDEQNPATCLTAPSAAPQESQATRREAKEALIHEVEMAELAVKLENINKVKNLGKQKTPSEEIEESFMKHHSRVMGAHEFARRQKIVNAEKFKDDPEMLERANESIADWLRGRV